MDLSNLQPALGSKHSDNFRRGVVTVQETVRPLVRAIRVRKLVPEQPDRALKVVDAFIQKITEERFQVY